MTKELAEKKRELTQQELVYREQLVADLVYNGLKPTDFMLKHGWNVKMYYKYAALFHNDIMAEFEVMKQELRMSALRKLQEKVDSGSMMAIKEALRETARVDNQRPGVPGQNLANNQINIYLPEKNKRDTPEIVDAVVVEKEEIVL